MKGPGPVRSNTTVSLMSTVFYTVSFFCCCSLWKFLLKPAKNKVLCKDVRVFETWNALINRLDEINLVGLCSVNSERSEAAAMLNEETCKCRHHCIVQSHSEELIVIVIHTLHVKSHSMQLLLTASSQCPGLFFWRAEPNWKLAVFYLCSQSPAWVLSALLMSNVSRCGSAHP